MSVALSSLFPIGLSGRFESGVLIGLAYECFGGYLCRPGLITGRPNKS